MKNQSKTILSIILLVLGVALIVFLILWPGMGRDKANQGKLTKACVNNVFWALKGKTGFNYTYRVSVKTFVGTEYLSSSGSNLVNVGDTIYIKYEENDPDNSIVVFDSILKKREEEIPDNPKLEKPDNL